MDIVHAKWVTCQAWFCHTFVLSVRYGYVDVTDATAMRKLAEFLSLEPQVVSREIKAG